MKAAAAPSQPKPPVSADITMEGAGPFSLLPMDVIADLLQDLPLEVKLKFAIEVCKGLRPLCSLEPLWTRLAIVEPNHNHYQDVHWINGRGVRRLVDWLPNGGNAVTELALHVSKSGSWPTDDVCAVLKQFGHVRSLRLTGQGVIKKMLTDLQATPRPALKTLMLDTHQIGVPTVLGVLQQCPSLCA